jgi:hypothetical protein
MGGACASVTLSLDKLMDFLGFRYKGAEDIAIAHFVWSLYINKYGIGNLDVVNYPDAYDILRKDQKSYSQIAKYLFIRAMVKEGVGRADFNPRNQLNCMIFREFTLPLLDILDDFD